MQTTERPPTRPSRNQSPVRGVVLVAVAVVLGFFVLRAMNNTSADVGVVTGAGTTATTPEAAGESTTKTTAAKPAARPPGQVTVIVANASGVSGAAAKQTDKLKAAGYKTGTAANAPEGMSLVESQVMAVPGYEAEAAKMAKDLGKPKAVKPLPNPPPVNMAGANVLILLGTDLAQG